MGLVKAVDHEFDGNRPLFIPRRGQETLAAYLAKLCPQILVDTPTTLTAYSK
jgi:hypothetical protein